MTQHAGTAGNVRFYGSSTAANATFHNQVGGGTVYFNDASTAGDAHFFIEDTGTGTFAGHVIFNGNSKGGTADLTIRENCLQRNDRVPWYVERRTSGNHARERIAGLRTRYQ